MKKQPEVTAATRKRLIDAFWVLYEQKRVEQIRIKELTELANVHRGTFYEYYTDIYELLEWEEDEIIRQIKESGPKLQAGEIIDPLKFIADFYMSNGKRLNLLVGSGVSTGFMNKLKKALYPLFQHSANMSNKLHAAVLYEFVINGMIMAFHMWYNQQDRIPIDEFITLLRSLILNGIPNTIGQL